MRSAGCFLLGLIFSSALPAQLTVLFQNQEYDKAVIYLETNTPPAGRDVHYLADLGYAYFMNEQYRPAIVTYQSVCLLEPLHKQANLYLAQAYSLLDKPDSALIYYRHLIDISPDNYRYWQKAGSIYQQWADYDTAMFYLGKSYTLNPASGKLLVQYANLLIRQKLQEKADSLVEIFLSKDSANQDVITKRIDMSFKKGDNKKVISWGEKLWKDSADLVIPYINLAYGYLNSDSTIKCISLCHWLIAKNKANESVLYCAALAHSRRKNYSESNKLLDECLKMSIQKEAITYFELKGDNYEEMKQYQKAISYYDTAYYIFQPPASLYYTGRIYDKYLKNKTKATYYYRQYLAKNKTPRNSGELQIIEYIRAYLKHAE